MKLFPQNVLLIFCTKLHVLRKIFSETKTGTEIFMKEGLDWKGSRELCAHHSLEIRSTCPISKLEDMLLPDDKHDKVRSRVWFY